MEIIKIVVDGKAYKTSAEIKPGECAGCVFLGEVVRGDCLKEDDSGGYLRHTCWQHNTIFVPDVPVAENDKKYTVVEVLSALDRIRHLYDWSGDFCAYVKHVQKVLDKNSDPEYKELLRLKEKFGE